MRTTLAINEDLLNEVKLLSGAKTEKDAVEKALVDFIRRRKAKKVLQLEGKIELSFTLLRRKPRSLRPWMNALRVPYEARTSAVGYASEGSALRSMWRSNGLQPVGAPHPGNFSREGEKMYLVGSSVWIEYLLPKGSPQGEREDLVNMLFGRFCLIRPNILH